MEIGIDIYGRKMELYHYRNEVFCDHIKNGQVVRRNHITVDESFVRLFYAPHTSGAYIYDEIKRKYGRAL